MKKEEKQKLKDDNLKQADDILAGIDEQRAILLETHKKELEALDARKEILPRAEQILIIPEPEESRVTASGLIKPETFEQERKSFGVVKAIGSKIKDIKVGDIVIFASLAGDEIEVEIGKEKVEYRILYDDEVLATIIEK